MADRQAYDTATPIVTAGHARQLVALGGAVSLATGDLALNATTGLFKVPNGFTVVDLLGKITDVDTNAAPALVFDIGDAGAAGRFLSGSTAGQAGGALGAIAVAGLNYTFTADTEIVFKATTAAATAAAGTLTVWLIGYMA